MKTFNFIIIDIDNKEYQIDVNAESEDEAWKQLFKLNIHYINAVLI